MKWKNRVAASAMTRMAPLVIISVISAATATLASCQDGRKAATLTRPTALKLLEKSPPEVLGSFDSKYLLRTRESIVHDTRKFYEKQGELSAAFLDVMVQVGILRDKKETFTEAHRYGDGGVNMEPATTRYSYSVIPQANVEAMYENTVNPLAAIVLGKGAVKEITGIEQEGSDAVVEVTIQRIPTALYEKITTAAKPLFAQCASFQGDQPVPQFCGDWLSRETLTKPMNAKFHFVRYDDGWRVKERM